MNSKTLRILAAFSAAMLVSCAPPPEAPLDLAAAAIDPLTVHLSWTDASDDEDGFRIEAHLDGGAAFAAVAETSADETSCELAVAPGTTYHFRVCAFRGRSDSAFSSETDVATPDEPVSLPAAFPQKVLIEEITGTWCGFCPDGAWMLQQLVDDHPGLVYGAAHHDDALKYDATDFNEFDAGLGGIPFYPSGAVNRLPTGADVFVDRGEWSGKVGSILATTATDLGLRVRTVRMGSQAAIVVTAGFTADRSAQTLRVTVLVTEDGVTGYPQYNYYNDDVSSPFYHQGNPIVDFPHQHVVRAFVTPVFGDPVSPASSVPGGSERFSYVWTLPDSVQPTKLHVVAILNAYGPSATGKTILNVQSVPLGEGVSWVE